MLQLAALRYKTKGARTPQEEYKWGNLQKDPKNFFKGASYQSTYSWPFFWLPKANTKDNRSWLMLTMHNFLVASSSCKVLKLLSFHPITYIAPQWQFSRVHRGALFYANTGQWKPFVTTRLSYTIQCDVSNKSRQISKVNNPLYLIQKKRKLPSSQQGNEGQFLREATN